MSGPHTFRSDNNAGLCTEALLALQEAASGHVIGYGDDEATASAVSGLRGIFGEDTAVYFVATGTAANTLAVAAMTEPWQRVLAHGHAHWNDDESTAPERMTLCRTTPIEPRGEPTRLAPADIERALVGGRGDVHQPAPGVLTLSNTTEFGTVYSPEATAELCEVAHRHGFAVHVDGARFANAVASIMAARGWESPRACRALSVDAGVDALSFGGTKNGLALGEAVLFFRPSERDGVARAVRRFPFLRKSTGHLLSKHRFVSAPFAKSLAGDAWLGHAAHANGMAKRLARGLHSRGISPAFPCEANGVFVDLPSEVDRGLQARGHGYYPFASPRGVVSRLMCSFDTSTDAVDGLLADIDAILCAAS